MTEIIRGDCLEKLKKLKERSIQCMVTSPPYWGLRDYGEKGQLGLEENPELYIEKLVTIFKEIKRVLKKDGVAWLNLGDTYYGGGNNRGNTKSLSDKQASSKGATGIGFKGSTKKHNILKPKDLCGIPWRVALALQADGWYLRQDIIWHKPNPMPESVKDRCTRGHEYIFMLTKSRKYYFDNEAIKEPAVDKRGCGNKKQPRQVEGHKDGTLRHNLHKIKVTETRNRRSVWSVTTKPFKEAHFAVFPLDLIEPCILASSREGDWVLDPFMGAGTVALACRKHNRHFVGIELNQNYIDITKKRLLEGPK